jgi:predicted  nucleic acid-binding Zn-ribbon protein
VQPRKTATLRVVQKRTDQESFALLEGNEDTIRILAQDQQLSEPIRQALNSILNRRRAIRNIEAQIRQQEARIKSITDDQARIRENMRALDRNSDLYRQYVQKLAQQEREIEQARAEIERLQEQRARAQRELSDYIAGLNL